MGIRIRCPGPGCGLEIADPDRNCPACGTDLDPILRLIETGYYYYNEALRHIAAKDYWTAVESLAAARAFNPHEVDLYVLAAKVYIELDNLEKSGEFFLKAYRMDKNRADIASGLQWLMEAGWEMKADALL